jgi:hypothetical protein
MDWHKAGSIWVLLPLLILAKNTEQFPPENDFNLIKFTEMITTKVS